MLELAGYPIDDAALIEAEFYIPHLDIEKQMTLESKSFLVRPDADGTFHKFCPICLLTVATAKDEAELAHAGNGHTCTGPPLTEFVRQPLPDL